MYPRIRQSGELYLQILPLKEARVYSKVVGAQKCKCSLSAPPVKSNISSNFSFLVAWNDHPKLLTIILTCSLLVYVSFLLLSL